MSNIIDSIQLSGVTYTLSAQTSGGGVTTGEVQTMIDESISGKVDTSAITTSITSSSTDTQVPSTKAVYKVYTGCVTTNTGQNITGTKTFTGEKKILFKQQASTNKLGFTLQNSAYTNNELGTFEFRPNTFTIDGVQHPLLYLGHYRNSMVANEGVPQTVVGFRQYDQKNTAAYHYLIPLPEKAKTPFSLTTSYKDYYAPIGFKIDNSTMVTTDNTGVVDLSSYVGGIDSGTVQTMIDESISGKTNQSDFTAHTSNTSIHVTTAQTAAWDAKSNFSGSYNDLTDKPTIPTVPTSNTAFTNDAGYITDSALEDYATESYVTNGLDGKQDTLESGVNIKTVNNYSLLGSGNINIGGSGGNNVVELTQAEYDALDPKDPSAFYIITDAEGGDLANYMTSAQTTSAITQAVSGKTDNSDFTGHTADTTVHVTAQDKTNWNAKSNFSGSYNDLTDKPTIPTVPTSNTAFTNDAQYATSGYVDSAVSGKANSSDVYTKSETSGATQISDALSGKQDTLSAGTNISIVDNVISAEGGGGKAVTGGTNISVTTGETADTINCTIPAYFHTNTIKGDINIGSNEGVNSDYGRLVIGRRIQSRGNPYFQYSIGIGVQPDNSNNYCQLYGQNSVGIGRGFKIGSDSLYVNGINNAIAIGHNATSRNDGDIALGANATASGNSSVAIGSGATADGAEYEMNLNNQIKVTPSNQVYIYNKDNTEMICLQDQLGGGGSSYSAGTGIDITNDVISVTGMVATSAVTSAVTSGSTDVLTSGGAYDQLGGLKLVKLTQSAYDALSPNYDSNTLYVIVN